MRAAPGGPPALGGARARMGAHLGAGGWVGVLLMPPGLELVGQPQ